MLLGAGQVLAQAPPNNNQLRATVASMLPDFLEIDDFEVSPPSVSSSGNRKRLIYKFKTSLTSTEDLYSVVREVGAFFVVVPTLGKKNPIRVSGVLDLTENGETWTKGVSFSLGFEKYGRPIDRFGGPALIAGDPAGEARLTLIQAQSEAEQLANLQKEIDAKIAAMRAKGDAQLQAERERAAADMLEVIAEHARKRGELIAKQREEIARLETRIDLMRQRLVSQITKAADLKQMQVRLNQLLVDIAKNEEQAIREFVVMRESRKRMLEDLPEKWVGVVRCTNDANPENTVSTTLEISVESIQSSSFSVSYSVNDLHSSYVRSGAAVILNETIAFPLQIEFSAPGVNGLGKALMPEGFRLDLTADGRLNGAQTMAVRWTRDKSVPTTCQFDLSG
jgi:hypothetical protein